MITEKGTVKIDTKLDERLYVEITKKMKIASILFIVLGALAMVIALILTTFVKEFSGTAAVFFFGAFILFLGIVYMSARKKSIEHAKQWNRVNEYEFFSDRVEVSQSVNGETVDHERIYLAWTANAKETATLISFTNMKNDGNGAYYIRKESVSENELNIVRALLKLPLVPTAQIPSYPNPMPTAADANTQSDETAEQVADEQPVETDVQPAETCSKENIQPAELVQIKKINK